MEAGDLIDSRRYLSDIGVWPGPKQLRVERWLENFDEGTDSAVALALLESFVHISEEQIEYAVCSTIRGISTRPEFGPAAGRQASWRQFIGEAKVSFPLGSPGDATASGYIFARIAGRLGFPDERILDSEHLIQSLASDTAGSVIFLDDLAASGTQFSRDWKRVYDTKQGRHSMATLLAHGRLSAGYYLPVVATTAAKLKIETECGIVVSPTYLLDDDYSALAENTRLVPPGLRAAVPDFLARYGPRTGKDAHGVAGYGDLGLALSFHHGSPNNTLPELRWGKPTEIWSPLVHE